jgi:hypothetical protein
LAAVTPCVIDIGSQRTLPLHTKCIGGLYKVIGGILVFSLGVEKKAEETRGTLEGFLGLSVGN